MVLRNQLIVFTNTSNSVILFASLFCLGLLTTPSTVTASPCLQVDEKTSKDEDKWNMIFEKSRDELYRLVNNRASLKIDFVKRYFNLKKQDLRKASILAKGETAKQLAEHGKQLKTILKSKIKTIDGSKFSVNGTEYFLGERAVKAKAFVDIQLNLQQNGTYLDIMAMRPLSGRGSGFYLKPSDIGQARNWRKSFPILSGDQVAEIKTQLTQRGKQGLQRGLLLVLSDLLQLDNQQERELEDWLRKRVRKIGRLAIIDEIKSRLNARQLMNETPEFLDELQKTRWRQLKHNPDPLGL